MILSAGQSIDLDAAMTTGFTYDAHVQCVFADHEDLPRFVKTRGGPELYVEQVGTPKIAAWALDIDLFAPRRDYGDVRSADHAGFSWSSFEGLGDERRSPERMLAFAMQLIWDVCPDAAWVTASRGGVKPWFVYQDGMEIAGSTLGDIERRNRALLDEVQGRLVSAMLGSEDPMAITLYAHNFGVDPQCIDITRLFRLPRVARTHKTRADRDAHRLAQGYIWGPRDVRAAWREPVPEEKRSARRARAKAAEIELSEAPNMRVVPLPELPSRERSFVRKAKDPVSSLTSGIHDVRLALSGALLRVGLRDTLAATVHHTFASTGKDTKPEDSRSAVESTVRRAQAGDTRITGLTKLRSLCPELAKAVVQIFGRGPSEKRIQASFAQKLRDELNVDPPDYVDLDAVTPRVAEILSEAQMRPGITVVHATVGAGKTHGALRFARDRRSGDGGLVLEFGRHDAADEAVESLERMSLNPRKISAPYHGCPVAAPVAQALAPIGYPITATDWYVEHEQRCAICAPQPRHIGLLRVQVSGVGGYPQGSMVITDDPIDPIELDTLTAAHIADALDHRYVLWEDYSNILTPAVRVLGELLPESDLPIETLLDDPRFVEIAGRTQEIRAQSQEKGTGVPLSLKQLDRTLAGTQTPADAVRPVVEAVRVFALVEDLLQRETLSSYQVETLPSGGHRIHRTRPHRGARDLVRHAASTPVVLLSATPRLHARTYEATARRLGLEVDIRWHRIAVPDRATVERTIFHTQSATSEKIHKESRTLVRCIEKAVAGVGPDGDLVIVTRKSWRPRLEVALRTAGCRLITEPTSDIEPSARSELSDALSPLAGRSVGVMHFGAVSGLNWAQSASTLITIGDPIANLDAMGHVGVWLDDEETYIQIARDLARDELTQAHGRLRAVRREGRLVMTHIGMTAPSDWRSDITQVVDATSGHATPKLTIDDLDRVRGLSHRAAARELRVDHHTVASARAALSVTTATKGKRGGKVGSAGEDSLCIYNKDCPPHPADSAPTDTPPTKGHGRGGVPLDPGRRPDEKRSGFTSYDIGCLAAQVGGTAKLAAMVGMDRKDLEKSIRGKRPITARLMGRLRAAVAVENPWGSG